MAKALQRRRGTTAEHANFTGLEGEFTYNTTEKRIVAHDGSTKGGIPMAKKSELDSKLNTGGGTMTGRLTVKYGYRGITQQFAAGETFSDYAFLDESGNLIGNIRTVKASSGLRSIAISANGKDANGSVTWKTLSIGCGAEGGGAFCAFDNKNILTEETGAAKDHTHTDFKVSSGRPVTTFQSGATASSIAFKDKDGTFKGEIGIGAGGVPIFINSSYSVNNMIHAGNISSYASTGVVSEIYSLSTSGNKTITVTGVTAYKPLIVCLQGTNDMSNFICLLPGSGLVQNTSASFPTTDQRRVTTTMLTNGRLCATGIFVPSATSVSFRLDTAMGGESITYDFKVYQ